MVKALWLAIGAQALAMGAVSAMPAGDLAWVFPEEALSRVENAEALREEVQDALQWHAEYWTGSWTNIEFEPANTGTRVSIRTGDQSWNFTFPTRVEDDVLSLDWEAVPAGLEVRYAHDSGSSAVVFEILALPMTPIPDTPEAVIELGRALGLPSEGTSITAASDRVVLPVLVDSEEAIGTLANMVCECTEYTLSHGVSSRRLNQMKAYVANETLVAVRLTPWIDIDASTVLNPDEAALRMSQEFDTPNVRFLTVEFQFPTLVYVWRVGMPAETLTVRQDASTGAVLTASSTATLLEEHRTPATASLVSILALVAAAQSRNPRPASAGERGPRGGGSPEVSGSREGAPLLGKR
jgi:hypothetical protein